MRSRIALQDKQKREHLGPRLPMPMTLIVAVHTNSVARIAASRPHVVEFVFKYNITLMKLKCRATHLLATNNIYWI